MSRSYSYDYPEVRPPHPRAQYPTESQPTDGHLDSRYSWMNPPGEEPIAQRPRPPQRSSTAPPLPAVPDHPHVEPELRHQITRERSVPQLQLFPSQQLYTQQSQHGRSYQQQYSQPQPLQQGQTLQSPMNYGMAQANVTHFQQQQQQQPPSRGNLHVETLPRPDPVKETPDHPNYHGTIAPDENPLSPLSPVSPGFANTDSQRQNTNMSRVPPTPSHYNFTSYAPVPQPATGGSWSHGLCSCSEPSICITGLFCPCVLYGRTQYKLNQRSQKQDSTNMLGHQRLNGSCLIWGLLCGVNGLLTGFQKSRLRKSYDMGSGSGSIFSDCIEGCCCCCCVLARNAKEVKGREENSKKGVNDQGYLPPGGMTFARPPQ